MKGALILRVNAFFSKEILISSEKMSYLLIYSLFFFIRIVSKTISNIRTTITNINLLKTKIFIKAVKNKLEVSTFIVNSSPG